MINTRKVDNFRMPHFRKYLIVLFLFAGVFAQSSMDSLPFFYERSIYLENLITPGAWWASPTCIASIDKTTLYTSTIGLLGGEYSISTVRAIVPLDTGINVGVGVTGTGITAGSSGNGSNGGAQITSIFSFSRPSFEGALSYDRLPIGTVGGLLLGGTESIQGQADYTPSTYFFWGYSLGWLSPAVLHSVKLSLSTLSVHHSPFSYASLWDHDIKAGLLVNVFDSLVLGSIEYGYSLGGPFSFLNTGDNYSTYYEVLKGDFSMRVKNIVGILLGFSRDTRNIYDNGSSYHAGVELRRSNIYPFYGGYEAGVSPYASHHGSQLSIINRIWVGYGFSKKSG